MRTLTKACGVLIIGATLAAGTSGSACTLSFDDSGLARMQGAKSAHAGAAGLCRALQDTMTERPALASALARAHATLSLDVLEASPNRLVVRLVLHAGGHDTPGAPLELSQIDGGPPNFGHATLVRLAGHLLDADPVRTFTP